MPLYSSPPQLLAMPPSAQSSLASSSPYETPCGLPHVVEEPLEGTRVPCLRHLHDEIVVGRDNHAGPLSGVVEEALKRQIEHVGSAGLDRRVQPVAVTRLALRVPQNIAPAVSFLDRIPCVPSPERLLHLRT